MRKTQIIIDIGLVTRSARSVDHAGHEHSKVRHALPASVAVLKCPEVALKVLRVVGGRLRSLVAIIEELSFSTVRHRLAALLLRLAGHGEHTARGVEVVLPASQQEIAAQIGTVRELVSRGLSRLQAQGIIEIDGRKIMIRDVKTLEKDLEDSP